MLLIFSKLLTWIDYMTSLSMRDHISSNVRPRFIQCDEAVIKEDSSVYYQTYTFSLHKTKEWWRIEREREATMVPRCCCIKINQITFFKSSFNAFTILALLSSNSNVRKDLELQVLTFVRSNLKWGKRDENKRHRTTQWRPTSKGRMRV